MHPAQTTNISAVLVNVAGSFCSGLLSTHSEKAHLGSSSISGGCKTPEICVCVCVQAHAVCIHVLLCNNWLIVTAVHNLAESCFQSSYEKQRACFCVTAQ